MAKGAGGCGCGCGGAGGCGENLPAGMGGNGAVPPNQYLGYPTPGDSIPERRHGGMLPPLVPREAPMGGGLNGVRRSGHFGVAGPGGAIHP